MRVSVLRCSLSNANTKRSTQIHTILRHTENTGADCGRRSLSCGPTFVDYEWVGSPERLFSANRERIRCGEVVTIDGIAPPFRKVNDRSLAHFLYRVMAVTLLLDLVGGVARLLES